MPVHTAGTFIFLLNFLLDDFSSTIIPAIDKPVSLYPCFIFLPQTSKSSDVLNFSGTNHYGLIIFLSGPFIFIVVNLKKRPAITSSVSYDMGSCPFILVIVFSHNQQMATTTTQLDVISMAL